MSKTEMTNKVRELKELKTMAEELAAEIMELDLTRLNSLAFTDFKREQEKKQAPESPTETQTASREYKNPYRA